MMIKHKSFNYPIGRRDFLLVSLAITGQILSLKKSSIENYDTLPEHIRWELSNSSELNYNFDFNRLKEPIRKLSFVEAIEAALLKLNSQRQNRSIALFLSGGYNSELIAEGLNRLSIPHKLYFVNFWGINKEAELQSAQKIASRMGLRLNIINMSLDEVLSFKTQQLALQTGCAQPTYHVLSLAFNKIPKSEFILLGEGGLDRSSLNYKNIDLSQVNALENYPFKNGEVFYRVWAQKNQRFGQYYFFNSTPELILSSIQNLKKTKTADGRMEIYLPAAYENVPHRSKTTNWNSARSDFKLIKKHLLAVSSKNLTPVTS